MTEQDERTIYEWVLGHSLDKQLTVQPPDMNFAFAVCIPKLRAEGITAWFDNRDWYLDEVATENVSVDADFYSALLAYIKGVTLPTIDEFIGSDPDFTGGKSTKEYIEEMRS